MRWMPEKEREMFDKLVAMAIRLGRDPTFKEVEQDPALPHPNDYAYFFGSFTEALNEAHRQAFVYKKRESPLPDGKIFSKEEIEAMSRKAITDEEYVVGIIRLKKELGHFPSILEMNADKRSPSVTSYERRFGTNWNGVKSAILRKAGDLGITEENVDTFVIPEKKAAPVKSEPTERSVAVPKPMTESKPVEEPKVVTEAEVVTKTEVKPETAALAQSEVVRPAILAGLASEPALLSEAEPEGNRLISLLPQTRILEPKVEGYATLYEMKGLIPLQKTVVGVPVVRNCRSIQLFLNGQTGPLPEPCENVFYIVERKIASIAKLSGRETYDLLIPEKFEKNKDGIVITEFSIL